MKRVNTVLSKYFNLPNPGLNSFLDRTERGQPDDYRTPFWGKADRETVVSEWLKVVDNSDVNSKMPGLHEFEMEQKGKVGPLSIMKPFEGREDDVVAYYALSQKDVLPVDRRALSMTKSELRKGSLLPMSVTNTLENMILSTNSGAPYFQKRRTVVDDTLALIASGKYLESAAAVLGWRGQSGGPTDDDVKQRVVWMFPFAVNIKELSIYKPMIKAWQTDKTFPALISLRAVEEHVTELFRSKEPNQLVVATDFSKFDQHINKVLQDVALELIDYQFVRGNFQFREFIQDVFPLKYNIPLVCTDEVTFEGPHGMGSGSGGTNADENLIHRTLQHEAAISNGAELNKYSTCLGDDGIISYPGITAEQVIKSYTSHGLDMNPSKQYVSPVATVYLQRYYHVNFRDRTGVMLGVYSTFRALGRLLGQERFYDPDKWNPTMVTLRAWSIIENCKNSPLFEKFVDFVLKGDKYRLGMEIPGFFDDLESIVKGAREIVPDLLGYTQELDAEGKPSLGIRDWAIFKYLSKKRDRVVNGYMGAMKKESNRVGAPEYYNSMRKEFSKSEWDIDRIITKENKAKLKASSRTSKNDLKR